MYIIVFIEEKIVPKPLKYKQIGICIENNINIHRHFLGFNFDLILKEFRSGRNF